MTLDELAPIAVEAGYHALCMRASQLGLETPPDVVREKRGGRAGGHGPWNLDGDGRLPDPGELL